MKVISSKNGRLLSQFDNINENDIPLLERLADLIYHPKTEIHHISDLGW